MNPVWGKSCWQEGLLSYHYAESRNVKENEPGLLRTISLDDDLGDVVVLRIALHKGSSGVVDAVGDIRSRIVAAQAESSRKDGGENKNRGDSARSGTAGRD
jgi:hypothetical protein